MIWDPDEIHERPWPGVAGKSIKYEIGSADYLQRRLSF